MFTRSSAIKISEQFLSELKKHGFSPSRAILFGSYAKGLAHQHSDIDLAVWDDRFSGCLPLDIELINPAKRLFHPLLEVHTFNSSETVKSNPFIGEVEKTGISIPIP